MKIVNKTIVITGGTSGIGKQLAEKLCLMGNKIIIIGRSESKINRLEKDYPEITGYKCDLSRWEIVEETVEKIIREHDVDILINNAAVQFSPDYLSDDFNYDGIKEEINTNFTSLCQISSLLLPSLLKSAKGPLILNITSGLAITPKRSSAIYCATKAAIFSFTKSLRYQLSESGVYVFQAILPLTATGMTKDREAQKMADASEIANEIISGVER